MKKRLLSGIIVILTCINSLGLIACTAEEQSSFLYDLNPYGSAMITRYIGEKEQIEIPTLLDDCPVTSIGDKAFSGCWNLSGVTLPSGIKRIGDRSFIQCANLTGIILPDSVLSIGSFAFAWCDSLAGIYIPSSVTSIGDKAFIMCPNLIIYGNPDTMAETYARDNNIPFQTGTFIPIVPEYISPTPEYSIREEKLAEYNRQLVESGCMDENLDFCARILYAIDKSGGFSDFGFTDLSKTVLKNYLSKEQVFNFGKTGKGLDVVYFKDNYGKQTNIPALCYIGASDYNFGLKQVQTAIDRWEEDAPGFLKMLYRNDVCVLFQNKANIKPFGVAKYADGIIFVNTGKSDKDSAGSGDFVFWIRNLLGVEAFGNKMQVLGSDYFGIGGGVGGALKQLWGVKCCKFLLAKTGKKEYANRARSYQLTADRYVKSSGTSRARILEVMKKAETSGLATPYGADCWEIINRANTLIDTYSKTLTDCAPERIYICSRLLQILDSPPALNGLMEDSARKVNASLTNKEKIINYGKSGKGIKILANTRKQPLFQLINVSSNVEKQLKAALAQLEKETSGAQDKLADFGLTVFIQTGSSATGEPWIAYDGGIMLIYCDKEDEKALGSKGLKELILVQLAELLEKVETNNTTSRS